jgi:hypothetical protein
MQNQEGSVINPKTNRKIKIGSRKWRELVSDGIITETGVQDKNVLHDFKNDSNFKGEMTDNMKIMEEMMINKKNKQLPNNMHAVRGRGKYKDKIVKRRKMHDTSRQGRPKNRQPTQNSRAQARHIINTLNKMDEIGDIEGQLALMLEVDMEGHIEEDYEDDYEEDSEEDYEDYYEDDYEDGY